MDHRQQFSKWWLSEFKVIKFPNQGTVFDYYIHPKTKSFSLWDERVPAFELDPDIPLQVFPTSTVFIWFDCQSTAFPSVMCGASSGLRLVAPIKPDGFQWFSLPHRSLRQGL